MWEPQCEGSSNCSCSVDLECIMRLCTDAVGGRTGKNATVLGLEEMVEMGLDGEASTGGKFI